MSKTIIAVRGVSNAGKTTSIKRACELVKIEYPSAKVTQHPGNVDIFVEVEINRHIIVFYSRGDRPDQVRDIFQRIERLNWNVLVCATRSKGETVDIVEGAGFDHLIWIYKSRWTPDDETMARGIIDYITGCLDVPTMVA